MARKEKEIKLDDLERFMEELKALRRKVLQIDARYHEMGQSHWLGGSIDEDAYESPHPTVQQAFKVLDTASRDIDTVMGQLLILSFGCK